MKNYYRIMLGKKSSHADEAYKGNFVGAGFIKDKYLTQHLPDNWREFNGRVLSLPPTVLPQCSTLRWKLSMQS